MEKTINYLSQFGPKIFLSKLIKRPFYDNKSLLGKKINLKNESIIKHFLRKNIIDNLDLTERIPIHPIKEDIKVNNVIWTMWWQGEESAPEIVKACLRRLKAKNKAKNVIVITKNNFTEYVNLKSNILNLYKNKNISITHLSDIIRVNLLYQYGGIWIDSTVWCEKELDAELFDVSFYSINTGRYTNDPSHGRWTTFFMSSTQGTDLMNFLVMSFNRYLENYDYFVDYILFDYFINIACDLNKTIDDDINSIPINNTHTFELSKFLNFPYSKDLFYKDTYLYKLTYKMDFKKKKTKNLYQYLVSNTEK